MRQQSHPRDPPQGYAEFQRTMAKKCLKQGDFAERLTRTVNSRAGSCEVPPGGRTRVSPVPFVIAVASGVGGTQRIETTGQATTTKKGTKAAPPKRPALKGSGSPSEPSGPGASHPFRPRRKIPLIRLEPTDGAQPRINFRLALVSTIYAITELRIIGDLPSPSLLRCKSMGTRRHPQHRHPAVHARADKIPPPKMKPP